jgi:hypothetical protein
MLPEELVEEIASEMESIEELFNKYGPLIEKVRSRDPDFFELGSLAMLLHSFYNGLENIFTRVAKRIDDKLPAGKNWHKELLEQMTTTTEKRDYAVIKVETASMLKMFLGFRHFTRHAYAFDFNWDIMRNLIFSAEDAKGKVFEDLRVFLRK